MIRTFLVILVTLKLFLNAKCSLSLWNELTIGHRKWFLNTNLFLIKTFLITKFVCSKKWTRKNCFMYSKAKRCTVLGARKKNPDLLALSHFWQYRKQNFLMIYGENLDITTIVQCLTGWGPPFILQFQTDKKKAFLSSWFIDLLGMFIDPMQLYKKTISS